MVLRPSSLFSCLVLSSFMLLSGCSFKKDANKPDEVPPTVIVEKSHREPPTALEALLLDDMIAFEKLVTPMSFEQINEYQKDGSTLLWVAVGKSNHTAVGLLLEKGALPLKPGKNSEVTPLNFAAKTKESIFKALLEVVHTKKTEICREIEAKQYLKALKLLNTNFIKSSDHLREDFHFLDLVLKQESVLTPETKDLVLKLLSEKPSLEKSKELLLRLSLGDPLFFSSSANAVFAQNLQLEKAFVLELIQKSPLHILNENLETLNRLQFFAGESLAVLQKDYLNRITQSQSAGQLLALNQIQKTLSLLIPQASELAFCSECIEVAITHPALKSQRGDLIRLLVLNSEKAPAGFVKSLLGRLTAEDFRQVVSVLSVDLRNSQGDVFDGPWSLAEYQILKDLGMKMTAAQTAEHLRNLFQRRFSGDKNASQILMTLQNEWALARGLLSADEEVELFTKEFLFAFESDLAEKELLSILESVKVSKLQGLLMGEVQGERLWLNPEHLFKFKKSQGMSGRFERLSLEFINNTLRLIPDLRKDWFLKTDSWVISDHDLLWVNLLESELGALRLLPQLQNNLVNGLFKKWMWRQNHDLVTIEALLSSTNNKFLSQDISYRRSYLPALLISGASPIKSRILREMIAAMPENTNLQESSFALEFVDYIKSVANPEQRDELFSNIFLPYITKQSPRLRLAFEGHQNAYSAFVAGQFTQDPLCTFANSATYKTHCDSLAKQLTAPSAKGGNKDKIDIGQRIEEMRREQEYKNSLAGRLLDNEKINITALSELSKLTPQSPGMSEFFKQNPWIFSIKFYSPSKLPY